ncbi:MAG: hypothetical protein ACMXYL_04655 [Candidatus Woesearchaeota archaeon]
MMVMISMKRLYWDRKGVMPKWFVKVIFMILVLLAILIVLIRILCGLELIGCGWLG